MLSDMFDDTDHSLPSIETEEVGVEDNVPALSMAQRAMYMGQELTAFDTIRAGTVGVLNSEIDSVRFVYGGEAAIRDSTVREVGSAEGGLRAIDNSEIKTVTGNLKAEGIVIGSSNVDTVEEGVFGGDAAAFWSHIGEIHGDVITEGRGFVDSQVGAVFGSIRVPGTVFARTHFPYVVGGSVVAEALDDDSYGGLVAAERVDVDRFNGNMFVLTPQDDARFTTYEGDWDELVSMLEDDREFLKGLQVFNPPIDSIAGLDELREIESMYDEYVGDAAYEEVRDAFDAVKGFSMLPENVFGPMVDAALDEFERKKRDRVAEFGEVFASIPGTTRRAIINALADGKDEHNPGHDLYTAGKKRVYGGFQGTFRGQHLRNIVGNNAAVVSIDEELDGSPYREVVEELYDEFRDEVRAVAGLAEKAGVAFSTDVEKMVKHWEYQRSEMGYERDPDMEDLSRRLEQELRSKRRAYTMQLIADAGREDAVELYQHLTGRDREPDELELQALLAYKNHNKNTDAAKKLLIHGDAVYDLFENQEWLEWSGLDEDVLVNGVESPLYEEGPWTLRVEHASPMESLLMGNYFNNSCLDVEKEKGWGAVANAVDINKQVLYARDSEDAVRGRLLTGVTDGGELSYFTTYQNTERDLSGVMQDYAERLAEGLGLPVDRNNKDIATLVADEWYTGRI